MPLKSFVCLLLPLFTLAAVHATNYENGDQLTVVAFSGLNLRDSPSRGGERLLTVPTGEQVTVVQTLYADKAHADTFEGLAGHWVHIRYERTEGYVFDAYLSQFPIIKDLEAASAEYDGAFSSFEGMYDFLPLMLTAYAEQAIGLMDCELNYPEQAGGESTHIMRLRPLRRGHLLVEHGYWEGSSTELVLQDARESEVYFLVRHLLQLMPQADIVKLDEGGLKSIDYGPPAEDCPGRSIPDGECLVSAVRKGPRHISLFFRFPCC